MQKLPALKRVTDMLICGEDLGLVPACVPEVMKRLGFLSLEIQRMPKAMGVEFSRPADAPYLSVVTPATHDMSTIRGWWEEDRELTQKFFNHELGQPGEAPRECDPGNRPGRGAPASRLAGHVEHFPIAGSAGHGRQLRRNEVEAERINVPANPNFYWRYRLHLDLEQLLQAKDFNARLAKLIPQNGR